MSREDMRMGRWLDLKRLIQPGIRDVLEQEHCEKYCQVSKGILRVKPVSVIQGLC